MSEDPLVAFRHSVRAKHPITLQRDGKDVQKLTEATHIKISPSLTLPKATPTRIRKTGALASSKDPAARPEDFVTLGAAFLAWIHKDATASEYLKHLRENGYTTTGITITERKAVADWLEGKQRDLPNAAPLLQVDSTTPPGSPPASTSAQTLAPTSPAKRKYVPDPADIELVKKIRANEIELKDRNSVLRGSKPNNFTSLQKSYQEKLKRIREASKSGSASTTPGTVAPGLKPPGVDPKAVARKAKHNYPIIMISSSPTALITMYNVKKFLEDAVFEPSADVKARMLEEGIGRPEDMIPIYRKKTYIGPGGKEVVTKLRYFIVDGTDALGKFGADAWDRVVCVMTTGQAWQFRQYKWSEPRQLFHHVKGMYVAWSNDPPNPKIQDWNVTELKIDPHRRHVDKSVVASFWQTIDQWTAVNKAFLHQ